MTLQFPTEAEKVADAFRNSKKTVSIATLARHADKEVVRDFTGVRTIYTFDDDTSLVVTGRGRAHTIETLLP